MNFDLSALRLYLVTDPHLCPGDKLLDKVHAAVRGGVTCVQLRDKHASTRERIAMAKALKPIVRDAGVKLIINDDVDAAIAADVDGVHVGQEDACVDDVRRRIGSEKILGLSCETFEQVQHVDRDIVDYLGLGTVFPTSTKADHKPVIGLSGLSQMAQASPLPCVAIGGIKLSHVRDVMDAGCQGVAVVSAICGHHDPEYAARTFIAAIEEGGCDQKCS